MGDIRVWKPTKRQNDFLTIPDTVFEALYGGSAGGGKSEVLLLLPLIREFYKYPRFKGIIFRRTYPELERELILRSHEYYPATGAVYSDAKKRWVWPHTGAVVQFGYVEHESDVRKYDTTEYNYMAFDELTSFTEFIYRYLAFSRCRSSDPNLPAIVRSASNPGNIGHCVPYGDVLTPDGWKDISTLEVGDPIYEVDPKTLCLVESVVEQVHVHAYKGKLWTVNSSNLHMCCTPEHRVLRVKKPYDVYALAEVRALPGQAHIARAIEYTLYDSPDTFRVEEADGVTRYPQPLEIPFDCYAELMGWFLSEGYVVDEKYNQQYFAITQLKEENRERIRDLLHRCSFRFSEVEKGFSVWSSSWYHYMKQFGKCRDKYIPRILLNSSQHSQRILFDALVAGDGHWSSKNSGFYYTTSRQLADDFCELAFKLGYRVRLNSRQRPNRVGLSYEIAFDSNKVTEILTGQHAYSNVRTTVKRPKNVTFGEFDGLVYDVGVPLYHTFVLRQNGAVWISGNSFVRARFVEPAREGYTIIKDSKTGLTRIFIPAKATDNPYLMKNDPQYVNRLQALPEAERLAKLEGDWWTFSGQVFEDWRIQPLSGDPPNAQHVIKPFEIPSWWPKLLAIDWGYSAMLYAVWGAISPKGRLIVYREYAAKKEKISTWAANVARLSQNDDLVDIVLDPSAWGNRGDEFTIAEQFEIHSGMRPRPADNDRIGGKVLLQELMRFRPHPPKIMPQEGFDPELADRILRIHGTAKYYEYLEAFTPEPEENTEDLPKLQVFETCPVLINTIPLCVYNTPTMGKSVNLEDVAEFDGDDPYDGLRYLAKAAQNYLTSGVAENERREALDRAIADFKRTEDRLALHMRLDKIFAEERRSGLPVKRFHRARTFARTI